MAQEACHRSYVRAVGNQEAGVAVAKAMHIQLFRQAVLFEDQLEPPGEGTGRHGIAAIVLAEYEVILCQLTVFVGIRLPVAFLPVFFQQAFHLWREVHVAVTGSGLGRLGEHFFPGELDHVALDVDAVSLEINVRPLQSAALTPAHPGGNDEFVVGFVLETFIFQRGDNLLYCFLVCNQLILFLPGVFVGAPGRIVIQKSALHRVGEDTAEAGVDALNGVLGDRQAGVLTAVRPEFGVELPEVLRAELGQLVPAQVGHESADVLPVPCQGGFRQLIRSDIPEPDLHVLLQGDGLVHCQRRFLALFLEEHSLLVEPLLFLLWSESLGRLYCLLSWGPTLAVVVVAHGDYQEVAVPAFSYACHNF